VDPCSSTKADLNQQQLIQIQQAQQSQKAQRRKNVGVNKANHMEVNHKAANQGEWQNIPTNQLKTAWMLRMHNRTGAKQRQLSKFLKTEKAKTTRRSVLSLTKKYRSHLSFERMPSNPMSSNMDHSCIPTLSNAQPIPKCWSRSNSSGVQTNLCFWTPMETSFCQALFLRKFVATASIVSNSTSPRT